MYSIEGQKRGLPHAHIHIWLLKKKIDHTKKIICAEIPNRETDPSLLNVVVTNMIQGPCGAINSLTTVYGPRQVFQTAYTELTAETVTGKYRPVKSMKYIYKYATKSSDMAVFGIQSFNTTDENTRYRIRRDVNCNEPIWRIFSFPINERHPTVE